MVGRMLLAVFALALLASPFASSQEEFRDDIRRLLTSDLDPIRVGPDRPGSVENLNLADCGLVHIDSTALRDLDNLTSLTLSRCLVNQSVISRSFVGSGS